MVTVSIELARRVQARAHDVVSKKAVVTGVGLARVDGSYVVKVNLRDAPRKDLPQQIDGVPLLYERTGQAFAR